jgi:hypothetical protein
MLVMAFLAEPNLSNSEPSATIPMVECEINGFGLGGSADQMRTVFGEPEPISIAKSPTGEYPHREYRYDGIRFVFSTHGRSAMSYFVSSPKYRLRSGVGVGSTRAEIDEALGSGRRGRSGDSNYLTNHVIGADDQYIPAWLTFRLVDDVVTTFSVTTRQ